jgi:predicted porin
LSGGFGTFLLGKMNTAYKSSTVKWDPFLATFMQARGNNGMSGAGHNGYASNVIAYANKFGPVTLVVAGALDESDDLDADGNPGVDGEKDGDHAVTASVNAPIGPVELAVAYIDTAGIGDGTVDGTDNIEAIKAGVKFATGAFTIAGQYETIDIGGTDFADLGFLTGSFTAGKNTFSLSLGATIPEGQKANGDDKDPATYIALGAKHAFNKKVSTLIGVTQSEDNDFDSDVDDNNLRAGISTRIKF